MKVSKVVLVVVALHVLVIGGIFIFEGCSRAKAPGPQLAENETQPNAQTPAPTPAPATVPDSNLTAATPTPAPTAAPAPAPVAPAPVPAKVHIVKKGESLYKIAKAEKTTIEQLAAANNLSKTSILQIGQKLVIPTAIAKADAAPSPTTTVSAPAPSASVDGDNRYTVKAGDSLWKIAKNNGITVAMLKQANNLTKDTLRVGQKLVIPAKAAAAAPVTTTALTTEPNQPTYIVLANETLAIIAHKHGVKVEDLMRVNKLTTSTRLTAGQKLIIPQAPSAPANASPAVIAPNLIGN
jgi:N-acetylmuramoyl-L-alanine amidase